FRISSTLVDEESSMRKVGSKWLRLTGNRARLLGPPATIALTALLIGPPWAWGKDPYRHVLISSSRNVDVDPFVTGREIIVSRYATPDCPIPWSVRKFRQFGGKQEQVNVIWIDSGKLQISVIATRGMGILSVLLDGKRILGWDSPV